MNVTKEPRSKIDAAFLTAEEKGLPVNRTELGKLLFPNASSDLCRRVSMNNVLSGKTKRLTTSQLRMICEYLKCDLNDII